MGEEYVVNISTQASGADQAASDLNKVSGAADRIPETVTVKVKVDSAEALAALQQVQRESESGPGLGDPDVKRRTTERYRSLTETSPISRTITTTTTDPLTGKTLVQTRQDMTEARNLIEQENALRESRRQQFQSSDTEQYRARRVDASGKPVGDMVGAKAQLDLVNKELASMGSTTGMTSQQLDRYNTLLKRQADLSVDVAGKTKNLGADMLKHAGYVAYAALIWTTFRAVGEIIESTMTAMRSYSSETLS